MTLNQSEVKNIRGVGGGGSSSVGLADVRLVTDGLTIDHVILTVVPDSGLLDDDILLGKDILGRGYFVVATLKQAWLIGEAHLGEVARNLPEKARIELKLKETVELDPGTLVMVQAEPVDRVRGVPLVEDEDNAGALYDTRDEQLMIPVANWSKVRVKLKQGDVVTKGSLVRDENFFKLEPNAARVRQLLEQEPAETRVITVADIQVDEGAADSLDSTVAGCAGSISRFASEFNEPTWKDQIDCLRHRRG